MHKKLIHGLITRYTNRGFFCLPHSYYQSVGQSPIRDMDWGFLRDLRIAVPNSMLDFHPHASSQFHALSSIAKRNLFLALLFLVN